MPRLRTSSCPYTIRPVTLRLKAYPEYPNPTRDRPGWERRYTTGYAYSHMTGHGDTTITIRPSIGIRIWRDARIPYMIIGTAVWQAVGIWERPYTWSRFLLSVFQISQKPLWQVTIRDDRLNSHVPDFLFTRFHNGSCHPFFLCGCRFFPRGIMVCYRIGKAISITTMNYSVAIFVYSHMIRYPDNAITELRYSRISK